MIILIYCEILALNFCAVNWYLLSNSAILISLITSFHFYDGLKQIYIKTALETILADRRCAKFLKQ